MSEDNSKSVWASEHSLRVSQLLRNSSQLSHHADSLCPPTLTVAPARRGSEADWCTIRPLFDDELAGAGGRPRGAREAWAAANTGGGSGSGSSVTNAPVDMAAEATVTAAGGEAGQQAGCDGRGGEGAEVLLELPTASATRARYCEAEEGRPAADQAAGRLSAASVASAASLAQAVHARLSSLHEASLDTAQLSMRESMLIALNDANIEVHACMRRRLTQTP